MDSQYQLKETRGFSPIELLSIILLIGLLVLLSSVFLNNARAKARDAKRIVDVRRIQTALEFFNLEYGTYPVYDSAITLGENNYQKLCDAKSGAFVTGSQKCETEFISPLPFDSSLGRHYIYLGTKDGYTISFVTEKDTEFGPAGVKYAHTQVIDGDATVK